MSDSEANPRIVYVARWTALNVLLAGVWSVFVLLCGILLGLSVGRP